MSHETILRYNKRTCFTIYKFQQTSGSFLFRPRLDSIQIVFDKHQLVLPDETFYIGIIAYQKNGKIRKSVGENSFSFLGSRYKIEVIGGTNLGRKIRVNEQLMPSKGKYLAVKVYPRKQPQLSKEILIPLNYETGLKYRTTNKFDKAPGCEIKGELVYRFNNGKTRICRNLRNSRESEHFRFSVDGGYWEKGRFLIEPDFMKIKEHRVSLIVNSLRNYEVTDTFSILLDYKHDYKLYLRGWSGSFGFSGSDGCTGSTGQNGSDGQHGGNGSHGYNAPDIGVWIDHYHDSILNHSLLYVYAENLWTGQEYRYLVNPNGGKLDVTSRGGSGGRGGDGGDGGDGGNGEDGRVWYETVSKTRIVKKPFTETKTKKVKKKITNSEGKEEEVEVEEEYQVTVYKDVEETYEEKIRHQGPGGDGGDGGWGGAGGLGGFGGDGGNITLFFTDDARQYRDVIIARSEGGSGGKHGDGGSGGSGGHGGRGNPDGSNGSSGCNGPSAVGWAGSGYDGEIIIDSTKEFFFYVPVEEGL